MTEDIRKLHEVNTSEGRQIGSYEYLSSGEQGTVLFPAAMAVRQHFYRHYAEYLASQGYRVYTFDYAGIGKSRTGSLRGSDITMDDWIVEVADMLAWVEDQDDPEHYYYITHSLGGQFFGLLDDTSMIDAMISITSQNGYWKFYKNKYRYLLFWYGLCPVLYHLLGYFPGSKVGMGVDIPKAVMQQWRSWCTSENYFFDDPSVSRMENYDRYDGPLLTISFDDDPWATEPAVDDLVNHYTSAEIEHWHIKPTEVGMDSIGHFGFFKPKSEELWKKTVNWLQSK